MVVVRNVFQLKFGKAREAVAVMKEGVAIQKRLAPEGSPRLLTDVTGRHYTLVLEMTVPNLAAFEATAPRVFGERSFRRTIKRWCRWWSPDIARFSRSSSDRFIRRDPAHSVSYRRVSTVREIPTIPLGMACTFPRIGRRLIDADPGFNKHLIVGQHREADRA